MKEEVRMEKNLTNTLNFQENIPLNYLWCLQHNTRSEPGRSHEAERGRRRAAQQLTPALTTRSGSG